MLFQIHFFTGLGTCCSRSIFSLGLAHAVPDPFFHWAWHMLFQIHFFTGLGTCCSRSIFSLGLAHANQDPFFHWACLTSQTVHACGVCSQTGCLILQGDRIPKVCLRCVGLLLPLPSSLFGHDNPVYSCLLNSLGVSLSLSQVVPSLGGTYSTISSPQNITNKNLFCMCSQTCPSQAPRNRQYCLLLWRLPK